MTDSVRGIDPRAPRFVAALTAVIALAVVGLAVSGASAAAIALLAVLVVLFAVSSIGGVRRHPFAVLYRVVVRPRLAPPTELEDPAPPRFAQTVGLAVTVVGLALGLAGLPLAVPVSAAIAFVAAFLNAAFGFCLGCEIYLLLVRAGVIRRAAST